MPAGSWRRRSWRPFARRRERSLPKCGRCGLSPPLPCQPGILERRLRRKGETEADAQAAVAWMEELQLVDDLDTARQLVRRGLARGYGPGRLRQMLYEKQIPKTLWDQVLEDLPEPDEAIAAFLDRRLSPEPDRKELQKTIDALLRRGFAWQDIRRCLAQRGESVDGEPEE